MRIIASFIFFVSALLSNAQEYKSVIVPFESNPLIVNFNHIGNDFLISSRNFINGEAASSFLVIDEDLALKNTSHYIGVSLTRQSPFVNYQDSTIVGLGDNSLGVGKHAFIKLDREFHELNKITYDSGSSNGGVTSSLYHNGFLYSVISDIFQGNNNRDLKILKVDSCGNFIFLKSMDVGYGFDHNYDIAMTADGNLTMAREIFDESNRLAHISLISPEGEILWESLNEEPKFQQGGIWVIELSNGNLITGMSLDKPNDPFILSNGLSPSPPEIKWYSSEGEELNELLIHTPRIEKNNINKLVKGKGDYFFGLGDKNPAADDPDGTYGWIFKMDNEGNMIWNRKYHHPDYHEFSFSHNIRGMIELENGDIITAGIATEPGVEGEIWVMRLNSDGCLGDDCGTPITSSTSEINNNILVLNSYPNPTSGLTTIELPKDQQEGVITLLDANGNHILRKNLDKALLIYQLDFSPYPSGNYYLEYVPRDGKEQFVYRSLVIKN